LALRFSIKKPAELSQGGHKKSLTLFSENQAPKALSMCEENSEGKKEGLTMGKKIPAQGGFGFFSEKSSTIQTNTKKSFRSRQEYS
jgi:hypothetical protein